MTRALDGIDALRIVRKAIKEKYVNQRNCAEKIGISASFLSDMLNSRRELSPELLRACGLRKRIRVEYELIEGGTSQEGQP